MDIHRAREGRVRRRRRAGAALLASFGFALAGCGDVFEVTNPGRILDEDLNRRDAMVTLLTGISADYSVLRGNIAVSGGYLSDEMAASESGIVNHNLGRGIVKIEDVNGIWEDVHRARFNAEDGIRRMREVLEGDFDGNPLTARAHVFAALSNLALGENWCEVSFDGGPVEPSSAALERAIEWAQNGIPHAQRAGREDLWLALQGVIAAANARLGNWPAAVAAARQVPTSFVFNALYSGNTEREENPFFNHSRVRQNNSLWNTRAASFSPPDPRAPYTDCRVSGSCVRDLSSDGVTIHLREEKYPDRGTEIVATSGKEMRLIDAEAALRGGDVATAIARMNEARTLWPSLPPIDPASYPATALTSWSDTDPIWRLLDRERYFDLYLEGKRLSDLHRWDHPFLDGGKIVNEPVPRRASCFPISINERLTNPNIPDTPGGS